MEVSSQLFALATLAPVKQLLMPLFVVLSGTHLLSSGLLSKNLKIKIYRTIILPFVLYGCETLLLTSREERKLRVFEHGVEENIWT